MELKTNYQYSYFIYPFAVQQEKYKKYIWDLFDVFQNYHKNFVEKNMGVCYYNVWINIYKIVKFMRRFFYGIYTMVRIW